MADKKEEVVNVNIDVKANKNVIAALSYLWILSVVIFVLKKDDAFVKFHAQQGMVLFALSIVGVVPVIGWPIGLVAFVLVVIGALKAYQGEKFRIPVIADIAAKIDF